jgi:undecaprenyl-phosphate galactose phosphotransferase
MPYSGKNIIGRLARALKVVMDYFGAVIALILFSPVMLWVAWRIKREDGGNILFLHTRIGKGLKPFQMYKFRTMVPDAEAQLGKMLKDDKLRDEFESLFKFKDDPRITKVGHFLRRTSFDELPQLFNVLRCEMSLVGPRPIVEREVELYYHDYAKEIFSIKPGMTGLWQVSGRNDVENYKQRIDLDLQYIRKAGVWTDIKIILKTFLSILRGGGAY